MRTTDWLVGDVKVKGNLGCNDHGMADLEDPKDEEGDKQGLHSLRYFDVAVSEPSPGVPQFVSLGYVDGNLISRYDSETGKAVPGADWMAANLDQQYWDSQTQIAQTNQQVDHGNLDTLRSRYNQSG
ncbi:PREDICTED: class I histocompatibility antigen, F10 alpha chain-like, partial [Charadrius vociferus]|uniref:class I histocompatibility antigen, F10 alpha chain-like n=1 Tax=Charadrius vociferus TaxID=50402 RepID=UPI0005214070